MFKHCSYERMALHKSNYDLMCTNFIFEHSSVNACCNTLCVILRNAFSVLLLSSRQIIFSQFDFHVFHVLFVVYWTVTPTPGFINCCNFVISLCLVESAVTLLSFVLCVASIYTHLFRAFVVS